MSKALSTLTIDLVARTGGFVKGMSQAERESKRWRRQVERDVRRLGTQFVRLAKVGAAAGVAAAGAFTVMAKQGLDFVDSQAKMADRVGATIDGLRGLQIAGQDAGIEANTLGSALERMNVRLSEARSGAGAAYNALTQLGLSADALARMDADQRIAIIADRVKELGLDSAGTAELLRDLGIRNRDMVNLLMQGGDGIRAARQEVDDYGLSLSRVDAAKVEQANDALSRIPRVLEPIRTQIAINLADPLSDAADLFNNAAKGSDFFAESIVDGMEWSAKSIAAVLDQIEGVRRAYLKVREFELNFQAALEMGQNALTPGQQPTPAMDALEDTRAALAAIDAGETYLSRVSAHFDEMAPTFRQNREARMRELDSIVDTSGALAMFGNTARASAEMVEKAAQRQANIIQGVEPGAGPARIAAQPAGLNLSSITPMSADQFQDSGPMPSPSFERVVQSVTESSGSAGRSHTIHFRVNDDQVGSVNGDEAFIGRLADALSGAAGSVSTQ